MVYIYFNKTSKGIGTALQKKKTGHTLTPAPTGSRAAPQKKKTGHTLTPQPTGSGAAPLKKKTGQTLTSAPTGSGAALLKKKTGHTLSPGSKNNLTKKTAPSRVPLSQVLQIEEEEDDPVYNLIQKKHVRDLTLNSVPSKSRSPTSGHRYYQGNNGRDLSLSPLPEVTKENYEHDLSLSPLPEDSQENEESDFARSPSPRNSQKKRGRDLTRNTAPGHYRRGGSPSRSPSIEVSQRRRDGSLPDSNVLTARYKKYLNI